MERPAAPAHVGSLGCQLTANASELPAVFGAETFLRVGHRTGGGRHPSHPIRSGAGAN
jgi:hypothetical protein